MNYESVGMARGDTEDLLCRHKFFSILFFLAWIRDSSVPYWPPGDTWMLFQYLLLVLYPRPSILALLLSSSASHQPSGSTCTYEPGTISINWQKIFKAIFLLMASFFIENDPDLEVDRWWWDQGWDWCKIGYGTIRYGRKRSLMPMLGLEGWEHQKQSYQTHE